MARKSNGPDLVKELKEAISSGTPGRLYVFHGEETYLRDYYLNQLKDKICGGMADWNLHQFDGKACTAEALTEAVNSYPAFGGGALILVRDYDIFHPDEKMAAAAAELFPSLPDYACVVFVYDTVEYKPGGKSAISKLIYDCGKVIEFTRPDTQALIKWIIGHFKALGKVCTPQSAEYLIYLCGGLMTNLQPEIDKIGHYCSGDTITKSDIDAVATPTVEAVIFDLTDAVSARKTGRALMILDDLLSMKQEPVAILAMLSRSMRQLYAARLFADAGHSSIDDLMEISDIRYPFIARKMMDFASGMSTAALRGAVIRCAQSDMALKSSGGNKNIILETLLFCIVGPGDN